MIKKQSRTCIAVIKNKRGKLMMAGDRRATWDFSQSQKMPRPKVSKRDGLLLGGTGDGALCTLIVDIMPILSYEDQELDNYMFNDFRKQLIKTLKQQGYTDEHNLLKLPRDTDAEIIVGIRGRVYQVIINNPDPDNHYTVGQVSIDEVNVPYAAGCGGSLAWGALLESVDSQYSYKERLERALNIAASVSPGCGDGIDIINE